MSTQPTVEVVSQQALAKQRVEVTALDFSDPVAIYLNTGMFDQLQRVAKMMAVSTYVPEHLRHGGKDNRTMEQAVGDCFLVVAQAFRWKMDPFLVAAHTYPVRGKLGYEGKIIAALVNTHPNIAEPLDYTYTGPEGKPERTVTVSGRRRTDKEPKTVSGDARKEPAGWATDNPKWRSMTDQMLAYRGAREWARRYMPEAVLGVTVDAEADDVEPTVIDITPKPAPIIDTIDKAKEELRARQESKVEAPKPTTREPGSDDAPCDHSYLKTLTTKGTGPVTCSCGVEFSVDELRDFQLGGK